MDKVSDQKALVDLFMFAQSFLLAAVAGTVRAGYSSLLAAVPGERRLGKSSSLLLLLGERGLL
jgi:hypothetical protein